MRILHVITSLRTGGAERLMLDLLPRLKEKGQDVELCVFDGTRTQFYEKMEKAGVPINTLQIGGNVYNPLNIIRLLRVIRKGKFDIVHTHLTAPQFFTAIVSLFHKINLITTEHCTSNRIRNWSWFKPFDRWMYSKYQYIISISPATTENLLKSIIIKRPVLTIYNGINIQKFADSQPISRKTLAITEDCKLITMVAAFRHEKDQDTVIKAVQFLPEPYNVIFVGDGIRRPLCEKLAKDLHVDKRVKFLGIRSDVERILKTTDVVVLSSHIEGFGLAAVEGMAAGKPVIASNVPGLAEVVNGAGLLFTPSDEKDLADKILAITTDDNIQKQITESCHIRALQYDIDIMVNNYLLIYKQNYKPRTNTTA